MKTQCTRVVGVMALLLSAVLTSAQQPAAPAPAGSQTPTFKSEVEYVEVDVLVTDQQGQFVRDLKKEDFQVLEDGKAQSVTTFSLIDIPVERTEKPLFATRPIDADVQSNERAFDGRVYVMILDDLHTNALRTQLVKNAARQFIERNLGANDLMAVVYTGGRADAAQEFTRSKRLLLESVDKFMGQKLQSSTLARNDEFFRTPNTGGAIRDPYDQERAYNARTTLRSLKQVAEWFGGVRGRRKTILFVSEGIDYDVTDIIRQYDSPASSAGAILDDMRETIAATGRSNVSIYGIDPRGLTTMGDDTIGVGSFADGSSTSNSNDPSSASLGASTGRPGIGLSSLTNELRLSQDNLRALSEESGGFAAVNSNDFSTAFERIVRDNSSYYVLAYYPPSTKRDGKFHRISVRVPGRQGLTVRNRRGYAAPRGKAPVPASRARPAVQRRRCSKRSIVRSRSAV